MSPCVKRLAFQHQAALQFTPHDLSPTLVKHFITDILLRSLLLNCLGCLPTQHHTAYATTPLLNAIHHHTSVWLPRRERREGPGVGRSETSGAVASSSSSVTTCMPGRDTRPSAWSAVDGAGAVPPTTLLSVAVTNVRCCERNANICVAHGGSPDEGAASGMTFPTGTGNVVVALWFVRRSMMLSRRGRTTRLAFTSGGSATWNPKVFKLHIPGRTMSAVYLEPNHATPQTAARPRLD